MTSISWKCIVSLPLGIEGCLIALAGGGGGSACCLGERKENAYQPLSTEKELDATFHQGGRPKRQGCISTERREEKKETRGAFL